VTTNADADVSSFKAVEFGAGALGRLAVLTSTGQLHVIDGLNVQQLNHSVIDMTDSPVQCFVVLSSGDIIACNVDDSLNLWSNDDGDFAVVSSCPMLCGPAIKCGALPSAKHVLVLHPGGRLVLWNTSRFVSVSLLDCTDVVDFVVVERPADSWQCIGTIAALQKSEVSGRVSIYNLPRTELVYAVEVHQGALLFASSALNSCVYLLEVWTERASSGWQVRRLAETDPETRLRRLLAKQRFLDAESFAREFDLDVQVVYRECISHLVRKLSTSVDDAGDELITELVKCLSKHSDIEFVVECCLTTVLPSLSATNQLLSLARQRLDQSRGSSSELHASLDRRLHESSRRLAAFQVMYLQLNC